MNQQHQWRLVNWQLSLHLRFWLYYYCWPDISGIISMTRLTEMAAHNVRWMDCGHGAQLSSAYILALANNYRNRIGIASRIRRRLRIRMRLAIGMRIKIRTLTLANKAAVAAAVYNAIQMCVCSQRIATNERISREKKRELLVFFATHNFFFFF